MRWQRGTAGFVRGTLAALLATLIHGHACAADVQCAAPAARDDGWATGPPAEEKFDPVALCAVLDRVRTGPANLHAVVVERHGRIVAELYRSGKDRSVWSPFAREIAFAADVKHDLRSISKSVVGLLYGIALGAGRVPAVDTPALGAFDDVADLRTPARDRIAIEHLLTMTSGLQWSEDVATYGSLANDETRLFWTASAHRLLFARAVEAPPGTRFNYNGAATATLAELMARGTGLDLREQARRDLFEPLGITDWEWQGDLRGRPLAFAGLRLRPRGLAEIGRLVLDHGRWRDRQIVPVRWIDASLHAHIDVGDGLGYGYQWWLGSAKDASGAGRPWAGAFGNGGQRLYVVPELDLSVTITAGAYNDPQIARSVAGVFRAIVATASP